MLKPSQPQKWDPIEGFRPAFSSKRAQSDLRAWAMTAILALAIAGVFAVVLGAARGSGDDSSWLAGLFNKSLVIHVIFSFVIWLIAMGAIFMLIASYRLSEGSPPLSNIGRTSVAAMLVAFALLAVPALLERGEPSLNNYVPAIIDPVFYVGLLAVAFAALCIAVQALVSGMIRTGPLEPIGATGITVAAVIVISVAAFALSWNRAGGMPVIAADNEDIFWAGGHILQFANTALAIGAWIFLAGRALGYPPIRPNHVNIGLCLIVVFAIAGFGLQFVYPSFSPEERELFTLYQYALAPVSVVFAGIILFKLLVGPRKDSATGQAAAIAAILSILLFATGGVMGIFVDGTDTRTPAHYHATIGAVTIALMGFMYLFVLPILDRTPKNWRMVKASLWIYFVGQFIHAIGFFVAGGRGAPRKVAGTSPGLEDIVSWIAHKGIHFGTGIASIGGVLFIWIVARQLLRKTN